MNLPTMYQWPPISIKREFSGECIGLFISQGNQASFFSLSCRHFSEINFFELRFSLRPGVCDEKPLGALGREKTTKTRDSLFEKWAEVVEKNCVEILCVKFKITTC